MDIVDSARSLLLNLSVSDEFESIARYYEAVLAWQGGDLQNARRSLEDLASEATPLYQAKALQSIGATHFGLGELEAALPYYLAAARRVGDRDILTLTEAHWMTAVVRGISGDHQGALADLERIFPVIRTIGRTHPPVYYNYLNSLAVELTEVGKLEQAGTAILTALGSPFAAAFPEWFDTRDTLTDRSRSRKLVFIVDLAAARRTARNQKPALARHHTTRPANAVFARPFAFSVQRSVLLYRIPKRTAPVASNCDIIRRVRCSSWTRGPPFLP